MGAGAGAPETVEGPRAWARRPPMTRLLREHPAIGAVGWTRRAGWWRSPGTGAASPSRCAIAGVEESGGGSRSPGTYYRSGPELAGPRVPRPGGGTWHLERLYD